MTQKWKHKFSNHLDSVFKFSVRKITLSRLQIEMISKRQTETLVFLVVCLQTNWFTNSSHDANKLDTITSRFTDSFLRRR